MTIADNSTYTRGTTPIGEPQAARPPMIASGGYPSRYRSVQFDIGDESSHAIDVTIQIQENGADKSGYFVVEIFSSTTEYGATDATNNTLTDGGSGQILKAITASQHLVCQTNSSGELVITSTQDTANTGRYLMVVLNGDVYSSGDLGFSESF